MNPTRTDVAAPFDDLVEAQNRFRYEYQDLILRVLGTGLSSVFCTIYTAVPDLKPVERMALSLFNDVIVCELVRNHLPIVDLRMVCTAARDYSQISPIEPSEIGGFKIARVLRDVLTNHDFARKESVIYPSATTTRLL